MNKKYFSILEDNKVKTVVSTEEKKYDAYSVLEIIFDSAKIIENNDETEVPKFKNSEFIDGKFYDPRPYPSWILKNHQWVAPQKRPEDNSHYIWNEDSLSWVLYKK